MNLFRLCRNFTAIALAAQLAFGASQAIAAATLLPNGEQCFQATAGINGMVGLLGSITGGSGGTTGTYGGVALTGGSGSGATANITVSGGAVTGVAILNPGVAYVAGDVLSATSGNIGNVTGFSVPVASISINSSLAGGTVGFYIPNTPTFKQTWFNADQALNHQNTNPVQLDANGCAIIYGTGLYRQVLKDSLGNTVWDQITADTSSNNGAFWAGLSGGSPNTITVTDPGFNLTSGSVIYFSALNTNTGPATLNPSGTGAIPILRDTTTGPIALTGGEITATNIVGVIYDSALNSFHLTDYAPVSDGGGSSATVVPPQGYLNLVGLSGGVIQAGDVIAATTVYYSPQLGNLIPIWNGSTFIDRTFTELTLALTSSAQVANTIYDACVFNNNGNPVLVTEPGWVNSGAGTGARGTGAGTSQLLKLNGIWVNQFQIIGINGTTSYTIPADQCTYVGSLAMDAASGQITAHRTYGQSRKFGVWNAYNRVPIILQAGDSTGTWSYTSTITIRPADNNAANSLTVFSGLPEEVYDLQALQKMQYSGSSAASNSQSYNGIGYNTTAGSCGPFGSLYFTSTAMVSFSGQATGASQCMEPPSLGLNTVTALENVTASTNSTITYFGGVTSMLLTAKWRG